MRLKDILHSLREVDLPRADEAKVLVNFIHMILNSIHVNGYDIVSVLRSLLFTLF